EDARSGAVDAGDGAPRPGDRAAPRIARRRRRHDRAPARGDRPPQRPAGDDLPLPDVEAAHGDGEDAGPRLKRVLLVCPEPLGHGQPAGVGIRFLEIARVLRADGHEVTIVSPDAGAADGCRAVGLSGATLAAETPRHDVAVVQGHVAVALFEAEAIPTVV